MPIYNPTAGGGSLEIYESSLNYLNGYDFFKSIGLLDDTFTQLIGATTTIPAFSSQVGVNLTIDNSVAKSAAPGGASAAGWDFAAKNEVLIEAWITGSALFFGVGVNESTMPVGAQQDDFQAVFGTSPVLDKHVGGANTVLASDSTLSANGGVGQSAWGVALYVNGTTNVQKMFLNIGGFWIPVLSASDASFTTFQSAYLRHNGSSVRFISPIYVWGK